MTLIDTFPWLKQSKPESVGPDGYPHVPDDPYYEEQLRLDNYLDGRRCSPTADWYKFDDDGFKRMATACCIRTACQGWDTEEEEFEFDSGHLNRIHTLKSIARRCLEVESEWDELDLTWIVEALRAQHHTGLGDFPYDEIATVVEVTLQHTRPSDDFRTLVQAFISERLAVHERAIELVEGLVMALKESGATRDVPIGQEFRERITQAENQVAEDGPDHYPVFALDADAEQQRLISACLRDIIEHAKNWYNVQLKKYEPGRKLLGVPVKDRAPWVVAICRRGAWMKTAMQKRAGQKLKGTKHAFGSALRQMLSGLLRGAIPFEETHLREILRTMGTLSGGMREIVPYKTVLKYVADYTSSNGVSDAMRESLEALRSNRPPQGYHAEGAKLEQQLDGILGTGEASAASLLAGEPWSDAAIADLESSRHGKLGDWLPLLNHCQSATGAKPGKKWLKDTGPLLAKVKLMDALHAWLPHLAEVPEQNGSKYQWLSLNGVKFDKNRDVLRGLVWAATLVPDDTLPQLLADCAIMCFKKIPDYGAPYVKLGNACLWAIAQIESEQAIVQLARLKLKLRKPSIVKQVEKALNTAAEKAGVTRTELEEMAVPAFGMQEVGVRRELLGEFTAELVVDGKGAELRWLKPDGKPQKSVPKQVKTDHAQELKDLKKATKDLGTMLPAQRDRIERCFLESRTWSHSAWRKHYLDHSLVGTLARRLIWHFRDGERAESGIWRDGAIVDVEDNAIDWLSDDTQVQLWHPIGYESDTIRAWRQWLNDHEVTQPFKQAHREIYILTDAEITTGTYSNRFAAHILKQHQFKALADQRGWRYTLMGAWDSHNTPVRHLPDWDMTVEYWVDASWQGETTDAGIFLYITTDQVRFIRQGEPLPLSEVPALVFSELMRDVDLFVGVCSVGNDPQWNDRGDLPGAIEYWNEYSFGELNETANTRREVLAGLIPRLKISDRCELQQRFLKVRGDLRTYRIHLGSGNIQMDPNNQYLCIVPERRAEKDPKFLPFEGDRTLSIIISKALMLADDKKITDKSILSQINR